MASQSALDEATNQVVEISGIDDRQMIQRALKSNNVNVETVLAQYFDDPLGFPKKYGQDWNEEFFTADRDGSVNDGPGISFHIESPNEVIHGVTPPPQAFGLTAPSRPPSRSNNRSPLGNMVDWTADASGAPNSQAEEDEEMQRALRESAQEAGLPVSEIETGVTGQSASAPYFGPANRTNYEQDDWAMVPTAPAAQTRLNQAPPPSKRKRENGAPAFLVQGYSPTGDHRLGSLLTILHEIPISRNVLLGVGNPATSYGHNSEWWKGQEILPPHILAQMQSGELQWGDSERARPDFDEEIHRLMAFLDSTERSYGTVSVLTDLIPYCDLGAEKQFCEQLRYRNENKIKPLTHTALLTRLMNPKHVDDEAPFTLLEMDHPKEHFTDIKTLYESLDHVFWNEVLSDLKVTPLSRMASLTEVGDVLIMKVGGDGPQDSFEIPEHFYPERYLRSRQEEARTIMQGWCDTKLALARSKEAKENIWRWTHKSEQVDKRDMIKRATEQWKLYGEYLEGLARFKQMERSGFDTKKYPDYRAAPSEMSKEEGAFWEKVQQTQQYAEWLQKDLERKTSSIQLETEQIEARQRFLGKLLTAPDKPRPKPMTCKKFLLRGVATVPDVVYVCQRAERDLIELDDKPKQLDQWWRLAYTPNEEQPVKAEKIEIERVFRDMWQETKTPMLVYATEDALDTPKEALSVPLQRFMKAENKAFRQEINQERAEASEARRAETIEVQSPSKRKHRADSPDSMDSNRASIGSDDGRSGFDNPFEDQNGSLGTEMMDISSTSRFDSGLSSDYADYPPEIPSRRPTSPVDTSATITSGTLTAGNSEQGTDSKEAAGTEEDEDEAKTPEMQERTRPPSIMGMANGGAQPKTVSLIDMEIPEEAET